MNQRFPRPERSRASATAGPEAFSRHTIPVAEAAKPRKVTS